MSSEALEHYLSVVLEWIESIGWVRFFISYYFSNYNNI